MNMKKNLLLFLVLLMTSMSAHAVNWSSIETGNTDFQLYIDTDSVDFINDNTCVYAIKYTKGSEPAKVVFVKSNFKENKLGVIAIRDFYEKTYNAKSILSLPNTFMKPVDGDSFLALTHKYTEDLYNVRVASLGFSSKKSKNDNNIKNVSYRSAYVPKDFKEYVNILASSIESNWCPPKSGKKTQTIVIINVSKDGALMGYDIAKSSGDELTDRSVISAIARSAPFSMFPAELADKENINIQFDFEYKMFSKSVK